MRPSTYERVRRENPNLAMPCWEMLGSTHRLRVLRLRARRMNVEQLIKSRVAALLSGAYPISDEDNQRHERWQQRMVGFNRYEAKRAARLAKINKPVNVQSKEISKTK